MAQVKETKIFNASSFLCSSNGSKLGISEQKFQGHFIRWMHNILYIWHCGLSLLCLCLLFRCFPPSLPPLPPPPPLFRKKFVLNQSKCTNSPTFFFFIDCKTLYVGHQDIERLSGNKSGMRDNHHLWYL